MRTYGRIFALNPDGSQQNPQPPGYPYWIQVNTDANGYNDAIYTTTLIQVLKLNLGESPFWANYGIPAQPSVVQQVFPDYYVTITQQQFAPFFASLIISKVPGTINPTYNINLTTQQGSKFSATVAT